ncbi:hypothetical protein AGIG_G20532 [Arapaima gigas]
MVTSVISTQMESRVLENVVHAKWLYSCTEEETCRRKCKPPATWKMTAINKAGGGGGVRSVTLHSLQVCAAEQRVSAVAGRYRTWSWGSRLV